MDLILVFLFALTMPFVFDFGTDSQNASEEQSEDSGDAPEPTETSQPTGADDTPPIKTDDVPNATQPELLIAEKDQNLTGSSSSEAIWLAGAESTADAGPGDDMIWLDMSGTEETEPNEATGGSGGDVFIVEVNRWDSGESVIITDFAVGEDQLVLPLADDIIGLEVNEAEDGSYTELLLHTVVDSKWLDDYGTQTIRLDGVVNFDPAELKFVESVDATEDGFAVGPEVSVDITELLTAGAPADTPPLGDQSAVITVTEDDMMSFDDPAWDPQSVGVIVGLPDYGPYPEFRADYRSTKLEVRLPEELDAEVHMMEFFRRGGTSGQVLGSADILFFVSEDPTFDPSEFTSTEVLGLFLSSTTPWPDVHTFRINVGSTYAGFDDVSRINLPENMDIFVNKNIVSHRAW